eukprot:3187372-Pyramimonas_sp.AAC.1
MWTGSSPGEFGGLEQLVSSTALGLGGPRSGPGTVNTGSRVTDCATRQAIANMDQGGADSRRV